MQLIRSIFPKKGIMTSFFMEPTQSMLYPE